MGFAAVIANIIANSNRNRFTIAGNKQPNNYQNHSNPTRRPTVATSTATEGQMTKKRKVIVGKNWSRKRRYGLPLLPSFSLSHHFVVVGW